jgi:hypothetical protein
MIRASKILSALALLAAASAANVAQAEDASDRLMIVNGNSGHVVYYDGRDDLFCVTHRHLLGYNYYGHRVYRRSMHCR